MTDWSDGTRYDGDSVIPADTCAETNRETETPWEALGDGLARVDGSARLELLARWLTSPVLARWLDLTVLAGGLDRAVLAGGIDRAVLARKLNRAVPARALTGPVVFTTSFGLEDQALTHLIVASGLDCRFVTLDTGRLFPETYTVWAETEQHYGIRVEAFYPSPGALGSVVRENGVNGFYHSIDARHACCSVRKVEPLGRALAGAAAWLTGLRADQSGSRQEMAFVSYDSARRLLKVNPLLDWSRDQVVALIRDEKIPYNVLHDRGFLSIGCAPCTRAVAAGEPERAGRWWWEQDQTRECGLHLNAEGRLVRKS